MSGRGPATATWARVGGPSPQVLREVLTLLPLLTSVWAAGPLAHRLAGLLSPRPGVSHTEGGSALSFLTEPAAGLVRPPPGVHADPAGRPTTHARGPRWTLLRAAPEQVRFECAGVGSRGGPGAADRQSLSVPGTRRGWRDRSEEPAARRTTNRAETQGQQRASLGVRRPSPGRQGQCARPPRRRHAAGTGVPAGSMRYKVISAPAGNARRTSRPVLLFQAALEESLSVVPGGAM